MDTARLLRTLPSTLATTAVAGLAVAVAAVALTAGAHGPAHGHHPQAAPAAPTSVSDLTGPRHGVPDARFVLTARHATITLDSGRTVRGLTFDGTAPGPELRVRAGQLVEVVLRNADVAEGVTLHWHGLDVPNAEDGVAGVTQHAVRPGGEHVYRFRPDQVGTFWYHSHQDSARTVHRGLFGALVVEPAAGPPPGVLDAALLGHTWPGPEPVLTVGTSDITDTAARRAAPAGTRVRARLVNTDSTTQAWTVAGAPFTVVAIDGTDLHGPTPVDGRLLRIPAGGRYDVAFTVGADAVAVGLRGGPTTVFGDGAAPPALADPPPFDPLAYGTPAPTDLAGAPDREFTQVLDTVRTGPRTVTWTINGGHHPPAAVVAEGDLVRVTVRNDGTDPHPMHLHGHHVLVLSRDGVPASGSPWWSDSLGVEPGQEYVVAFRADNPGVWMDHCHNLAHAAAGMVMHLEYAGVSTPFGGAGNIPE